MAGLLNARFVAPRIFLILLGISSVAWAAFSMPVFRAEAPIVESAQRILVGDEYKAGQIDALRRQLSATPATDLRSTILTSAVVIRLRLLENDLKIADQQFTPDLIDLAKAVSNALSRSPGDSFLWLIEYWIQTQGVGTADPGFKALRMSYLLGPNEAWIAVKRNPLALGIFSSLPDELAEQALSEYVGVVRSGLYQDAANILAASGQDIRRKLLDRLIELKEADRREFAKVMESRNMDGALVPGLSGRPKRPF